MRFSAPFVLIALVAMPAKASSLLLEQGVLDAALATQYSEPMPQDGRLQTARAMLAYWVDFDSRIPRNSPTDAAWLEGEMASHDQKRLARVLTSPQYGIWRLSSESSNCVSALEALVPSIGGDTATELYGWLRATSCYQNVEATAHYLELAGLGDGSEDEKFQIDFFPAVLRAINSSIANGAAGYDR